MSTDLKAMYGYCPECYRPVQTRINGNDTCMNGHVYLSSESLPPKGQVKSPVVIPASSESVSVKPLVTVPYEMKLSSEQEKAMSLILSGHSFVMIAFRPTKESFDGEFLPCAAADATGCDFFTCMDGEKDTLMSAKEELPSVIDRLYKKKGML